MRLPRVLTTLAAGLGLLFGAVTAPPAHAHDGAAAPTQWRSYWVDAFNPGIYTPAQVAALVEDALDVNANALIVQTARRYDCFCNNALYPRTDAAIAPEPYDPLEEMVRQGHAAGLQVHAWVNVNTMWNSTTPPRSPDHVFNQHGPGATGADRWLNKKADGQELVGANAYVDPGHPAAVDYIVRGIQSMVRNYDVDGINLDYVRYPDGNSTTTHSDWGYNDVSVARFQRATGRTDIPSRPTRPGVTGGAARSPIWCARSISVSGRSTRRSACRWTPSPTGTGRRRWAAGRPRVRTPRSCRTGRDGWTRGSWTPP